MIYQTGLQKKSTFGLLITETIMKFQNFPGVVEKIQTNPTVGVEMVARSGFKLKTKKPEKRM